MASGRAESIISDLTTDPYNPTIPTELQHASNTANPDSSESIFGAAYDGIDWKHLLGYHIPNPPSMRSKWFWEYGFDIQKSKDRSKHWLCKTCHKRKWYRQHRFVDSGTDNIKTHLRDHHSLD